MLFPSEKERGGQEQGRSVSACSRVSLTAMPLTLPVVSCTNMFSFAKTKSCSPYLNLPTRFRRTAAISAGHSEENLRIQGGCVVTRCVPI